MEHIRGRRRSCRCIVVVLVIIIAIVITIAIVIISIIIIIATISERPAHHLLTALILHHHCQCLELLSIRFIKKKTTPLESLIARRAKEWEDRHHHHHHHYRCRYEGEGGGLDSIPFFLLRQSEGSV